MFKNQRKAKILIQVFCALTACSGEENNNSKLNHDWSDVIRPKPQAMSQDCRENLFPTRAADKARLDKASLYLTKLGHYVAKEVNQSYESEGKKAL